MASNGWLRCRPFRRHRYFPDASLGRMVNGAKIADRIEMFVGEDVVERSHPCRRDMRRRQYIEPFGCRSRGKNGGEIAVARVDVLQSLCLRRTPRIFIEELRLSDHLKKAAPM